ncbi:MAG: hypothetical protein ACK5LC_11920 [Coprobacillaceae bacterium]
MNKQNSKDNKPNKKDAGNNQWTNPHRKTIDDNRERKDGPGGN